MEIASEMKSWLKVASEKFLVKTHYLLDESSSH